MITEKDVQFYKEQGYLLVRGVFNTEEVQEMREAVEKIILRAAHAKMDHNAAWQGDSYLQTSSRNLFSKVSMMYIIMIPLSCVP